MHGANRPSLILLGGFELRLPGLLAPRLPRKTMALLAFLALHPQRPQRRERLAALLWGDQEDSKARQSLRQALAGLRRLLPAELLIATASDVALSGVAVDAVRFATLAASDADQDLDAAVALYGGDLLEGFDPRAAAFDEWLAVERSRLRELAVTALSRLLDRAQRGRDTDRVVQLALRLLALDPLRETTHRQLMRAYGSTGRSADALKQYRRLRRLLQQELQLAPEPATTALYREIVAQRREVEPPLQAPDDLRPCPNDGASAGHSLSSAPPIAIQEADASRAPGPDAQPDSPASDGSGAQLRPVTVLALRWTPDPSLLSADTERFAEAEAGLEGCIGTVTAALDAELTASGPSTRLLVLGTRRSHPDDPRRALQAAVQLRDQIPSRVGGCVAIAVHCGPALCGAEGRAKGPALHQCEALLRFARDGAIVLSDAAHQRSMPLAADPVPGETASAPALGPVWQLGAAPALRNADEPHAPLIGRRRELALLRFAISGLREAGGQAVLIRGEPGIGKTRLIRALCTEAEQLGVDASLVGVLDFGGQHSTDPSRSLLGRLIGLADTPSGDALAKALTSALDQTHIAQGALQVLAPLLGLPTQGAGTEGATAHERGDPSGSLAAAMRVIIAAATRERPRVLIVEDIHWAALPFHDLLAALAAATAGSNAMLVMTSRYQGAPLDPHWRAAMHGTPLTTIDLAPLTTAEGEELARELLAARGPGGSPPSITASDTASTADLRRCVERAAGHPLFLEQLLLAAWAARDALPADGVAAALPESVQAVVLARVDALPAAARAALQAASILGLQFARDALCELIGADVPGVLLAHRLLQPAGAGLAFAHSLIRDTILASMPAARRRQLHRAAAEHYQRSDPVLHARHLALAGAPEAAAAHLAAVRALLADCANNAATELAAEGLALTAEPLLRADLMLAAGDGLLRRGETEEARQRFEAAAALAGVETGPEVKPEQRVAAHRTLAQALLGRARCEALLDQPETALATLDAAASEALAADSLAPDAQGLTTEIRFQRGNVLFDLARFDECLSVHAAVAAEAQRSGSLRLQALAEGGLGDAEYLRGRLLTAHRHFARCVALAEQAGLSGMVPANLAMQAWTAFFGNRLEQGIADARRALALAQARQDAHAEGLTFGALIPVLLANGRREEAESESERSLVAGRRIGAPRQIADALAGLAEARGLAGDRDHAIVLLDEAMSALGASGLPYAGALIQGLIARFARSPAERRHAIAAGEALLADGSISHNHLLFHQHAIDAWLDAEDWTQVEYHADALADYTADEPLPWADFQIRRARALATAGRGSPDIDALTDLIDEGHRVGLLTALPAMERMLRRVGRTASGC